jgi:TonB family protein
VSGSSARCATIRCEDGGPIVVHSHPKEISMRLSRLTRTLTVAGLVASTFVPVVASAATITLSPLGSKSVAAPSISCGIANAPARITSAWRPNVPSIVWERNFGEAYGSVKIALALDSSGSVQSARVLASSGIAALDREALTAARLSRYAAERSSCATHGGTYAFTVDFDG